MNILIFSGGAFPGTPSVPGRHSQAPSIHHRNANPAIGTRRTQQQPTERPIFRCRPLHDSGMPIFRDSLACAWETPKARLHEKERPGMPVLRATLSPGDVEILPQRTIRDRAMRTGDLPGHPVWRGLGHQRRALLDDAHIRARSRTVAPFGPHSIKA